MNYATRPIQRSSSSPSRSSSLKPHFKSPEGRYDLYSQNTPPSLLLYKTLTQVTVAHFKDKLVVVAAPPMQPPSLVSAGGVRSAAARLWGGGNGGRALSFGAGSGGSSKIGNGVRVSGPAPGDLNLVEKLTCLIFNAGEAVHIFDFNSQDKDPIKLIHFSNSNPICHAFDSEAKDGHDFLIGLNSGDVYSASLRQQLQDGGKKIVAAHHYNKDGSVNSSRCTSVAWVPKGDGTFVVSHADGNLYVYEKGKDGGNDSLFPAIKDQAQFSVSRARTSKSNPVARWHISEGSINSIAFSNDGAYIATVGRDGYLRVFDYSKEQLVCGGKSYYGAVLCCAWSNDGKYILMGGEDDLLQVWSMEDRRVVAWGEAHNSWVSGVGFDSYWTCPDSTKKNVYRFGSVGQDAQLLLWDIEMDEIIGALRRRLCGGSPTLSDGKNSLSVRDPSPEGTLQGALRKQDIPKISPVVAHRVHSEPLSSLVFTKESILTASVGGHVKVWMRPGDAQSRSSNSKKGLEVPNGNYI